MQLSQRAVAFLKQSLYKESVKDENEIRKIFKKQKQPLTDALLHFQLNYGGLLACDINSKPLSMTHAWEFTEVAYGLIHSKDRMQRFDWYNKKLKVHEYSHNPDTDFRELKRSLNSRYGGNRVTSFLELAHTFAASFATPSLVDVRYSCADFNFQEDYELNAEGFYFENDQLICYAFETQIECLAMYDELRRAGGYKQYYEFVQPGLKSDENFRDVNLQVYMDLLTALNEKLARLADKLSLHKADGWWDDITCWYQNKELLVLKRGLCVKVYAQNELSPAVLECLSELLRKVEIPANDTSKPV
ncbi:MAG: hypothetical protein FWH03_04570 [Firmicutes bacterium]|nr:hypothetical protein [Bacillota bacterium]